MTSADVLLLLILAGGFLIGFFWGVVRGLLGLAAWLVVFLLSAYLGAGPVGNYLQAQWTNFSPQYTHMLAWLIVFALLFSVALILIWIGAKGSQDLSRYPLLDDVIGGLLGVAICVMTIGAVMAIFHTFYEPTVTSVGGAEWSGKLYQALKESTIGGQISEGLVPFIGSILGPVLPADIRGRI